MDKQKLVEQLLDETLRMVQETTAMCEIVDIAKVRPKDKSFIEQGLIQLQAAQEQLLTYKDKIHTIDKDKLEENYDKLIEMQKLLHEQSAEMEAFVNTFLE